MVHAVDAFVTDSAVTSSCGFDNLTGSTKLKRVNQLHQRQEVVILWFLYKARI